MPILASVRAALASFVARRSPRASIANRTDIRTLATEFIALRDMVHGLAAAHHDTRRLAETSARSDLVVVPANDSVSFTTFVRWPEQPPTAWFLESVTRLVGPDQFDARVVVLVGPTVDLAMVRSVVGPRPAVVVAESLHLANVAVAVAVAELNSG